MSSWQRSTVAWLKPGSEACPDKAIAALNISGTSLNLLLSAMNNLRHPLRQESEHYVILEAATASPVLNLEECMNALLAELYESELINHGTIAASEQQREELWHLRENIPEAEVYHGGSVKHDIAVRTSRLAAFVEAAGQLVRRHRSDVIVSIYGQVGDGSVHFNIVPLTEKTRRPSSAKWNGTFLLKSASWRLKWGDIQRRIWDRACEA